MKKRLLTALALVASVGTLANSVANLLLADAFVLATVELSQGAALAAVGLVALVGAIVEAVAAPLFRYAFAVGAPEFVLLAFFNSERRHPKKDWIGLDVSC